MVEGFGESQLLTAQHPESRESQPMSVLMLPSCPTQACAYSECGLSPSIPMPDSENALMDTPRGVLC